MGYAFNLCKFHIYTIPYNHNIPKEGMEMTQNRIRIVDVADALGLSKPGIYCYRTCLMYPKRGRQTGIISAFQQNHNQGLSDHDYADSDQ